MITETQNTLVTAVKKFAVENYAKDGWDVVVETMSDEEIAEVIGKNCKSEKGAIRKVKASVADFHSVREEIKATAW